MDRLFEADPQSPELPDLPPLKGTPAQIPWAADVRRHKLAEVGKLLREWQEYVRRLDSAGRTERANHEREQLRQAIDASERLLAQDTCRYFLDRRENTARELLAGAEAKPGNTYYPREGSENG